MDAEKIYGVVAHSGPLVPNQIKKQLGGDTVIIGAVLSNLVAQKRVYITHVKLGSSPFYYTKEQAIKLDPLLAHLNAKDRTAAELLKKDSLLQDKTLDPLTRVALRTIKDFAKPLEVNLGGQPTLFWKWYLLSQDDALTLLRERFAPIAQPTTPSPIKNIVEAQTQLTHRSTPAKIAVAQTSTHLPSSSPPAPMASTLVQPVSSSNGPQLQDTSAFADRLRKYFGRTQIAVLEQFIVRKGKDLQFILKVPSSVGPITFAAKALAKARANDADVLAAYAYGQHKQLPVLLILSGTLTKKGEEALVTYRGVTLKTL